MSKEEGEEEVSCQATENMHKDTGSLPLYCIWDSKGNEDVSVEVKGHYRGQKESWRSQRQNTVHLMLAEQQV